jgi:GAF domain-containing protein
MDIIQQKLVWLLASGAVLLLLFKLDLRRAGIGVGALNKLRAGFILILAGAAVGMIYRIGFSTGSFPESAIVFYLESLTGYVFGWALIIWGTIQWARDYFDLRGKLLTATSGRWIRGKISSSLIDSQGPNRLLEGVTDDLLSILSCQAVSLHRLREDGCLHLVFQRGLAATSTKLIENLKDEDNLYRASKESGQAMIIDGSYELAAGAILETSSGPAASAICVPVCSGGETLAILTAYRTRQKDFDNDDLSLIRDVCDGLSAALKRDIAERNCRLETRYREMLLLAARPFDRGEPLISALVKSAKLIHSYVPFRQIGLYVHDNGKPHSLDFDLPTGGVVTIKTGYFPEKEYPEFHPGTSNARLYRNISQGVLIHDNQKAYLFPICNGRHPLAHIKIELSEPVGRSSYLPLLGGALRQKVSEYLENERRAKLEHQSGQWLGALQYYQQRAISSKDLSELLKELTSLITDLIPSTFCRIMLIDKDRRLFKTAAMAQARKLKWPKMNDSGIFLADVALHRKALLSGDNVWFAQGRSEYKIQPAESARTLPSGIKHGLIVPLMMGDRAVGLLTVGESRQEERSSLAGEPLAFISSIAGLISMALTLHRERWMIKNAREGSRKLTLRQSHGLQEPVPRSMILGSRSRINGPLAGIMASCEYLKSCPPGDISEVNRFIDIIERNATKIHSITAEAGAGEQIKTPNR